MPRCLNCGNYTDFGSSLIAPAASTANGPVSGLNAVFDVDGNLAQLECLGASLDEAQEAWEEPFNYFDICLVCGSRDILW